MYAILETGPRKDSVLTQTHRMDNNIMKVENGIWNHMENKPNGNHKSQITSKIPKMKKKTSGNIFTGGPGGQAKGGEYT